SSSYSECNRLNNQPPCLLQSSVFPLYWRLRLPFLHQITLPVGQQVILHRLMLSERERFLLSRSLSIRRCRITCCPTGKVIWCRKGDRKSTRLNSSHVSISYA